MPKFRVSWLIEKEKNNYKPTNNNEHTNYICTKQRKVYNSLNNIRKW